MLNVKNPHQKWISVVLFTLSLVILFGVRKGSAQIQSEVGDLPSLKIVEKNQFNGEHQRISNGLLFRPMGKYIRLNHEKARPNELYPQAEKMNVWLPCGTGTQSLKMELQQEVEGLMFTIGNIGLIDYLPDANAMHPALQVKGVSPEGYLVTPLLLTNNPNCQVSEGRISFDKITTDEVIVFFTEAVSEITLMTHSVREGHLQFELSDYWSVDPNQWTSEDIEPSEKTSCEHEIVLLLDISGSVSSQELEVARRQLADAFQGLSKDGQQYGLTFIDFDEQANKVLEVKAPTQSDWEEKGRIAAYFDGLSGVAQPERLTNWSSALERAETVLGDTEGGAVFLLTDGLPNSGGQKKVGTQEGLYAGLSLIQQLRNKGHLVQVISMNEYFPPLMSVLANEQEGQAQVMKLNDANFPALLAAVLPDCEEEKEATFYSNLRVKPNPAIAFTEVELKGDFSNDVRREVSVIDISGKAVAGPILMKEGTLRLDLQSLSAGLYQVVIREDGQLKDSRPLVVVRP